MFCDDVLAVCVDIGHKKTAIGYVGDECPRYSTASLAGTFHKEGSMTVEIEDGKPVEYNKSIFGENLTCKYKDVQYHNIMEREAGSRLLTSKGLWPVQKFHGVFAAENAN